VLAVLILAVPPSHPVLALFFGVLVILFLLFLIPSQPNPPGERSFMETGKIGGRKSANLCPVR